MNLILKIHAWVYRKFGTYTKYARKKEQEYLDSVICINATETDKSLIIGSWQAKNGFYRSSKHIKKDLRRLRNKNNSN